MVKLKDTVYCAQQQGLKTEHQTMKSKNFMGNKSNIISGY